MSNNPLFDAMNNSSGNNMPPIVQQFMKFRNDFSGDPKEQVQKMLNSGQVTQEQYDRAVRTANELQKMIGRY